MTIRIFTKAEVDALRTPGFTSAQGWPLEPRESNGRPTCRCCGEKIAKHDIAMTIYLAVAPEQSVFEWRSFQDGRKCTRVWLHESCTSADTQPLKAELKLLEAKLKKVEKCGPGAAMLAAATASKIRAIKRKLSEAGQ
jgi:hypothetical protein